MHKLLRTIHVTSQNKLNGRPKIVGWTRSQSGTEKHMPIKGINPKRRDVPDGFLGKVDCDDFIIKN
jgi:hypothetical protein